MPDPDHLTLRKTVIGGETTPDDYQVIWDDLPIGRIFKSVGVGGGFVWSWSAGLPNVPQRSNHRGRADTLDQAKARFRTAWAEIKADLSYDQIKAARDIAGDRSRPWQKT